MDYKFYTQEEVDVLSSYPILIKIAEDEFAVRNLDKAQYYLGEVLIMDSITEPGTELAEIYYISNNDDDESLHFDIKMQNSIITSKEVTYEKD
jgi:hypothetical protein